MISDSTAVGSRAASEIGKGRPVKFLISQGNDHDITAAEALLEGLAPRAVVLADKGYDAGSARSCIRAQGAIPKHSQPRQS